MDDKARWDERYRNGALPWDTNKPDAHLVRVLDARDIAPCRVLEVGCGTGTNAIWLASLGFEVVATDIAATALERARAKARDQGVRIGFLETSFPEGLPPFELAFDRGVFHVNEDAAARAAFAHAVADRLTDDGVWISLCGSTDGPPREEGPPRVSAADLTAAVEPRFEILSMQSVVFETTRGDAPLAWLTVSRKRRAF